MSFGRTVNALNCLAISTALRHTKICKWTRQNLYLRVYITGLVWWQMPSILALKTFERKGMWICMVLSQPGLQSKNTSFFLRQGLKKIIFEKKLSSPKEITQKMSLSTKIERQNPELHNLEC